MQAQSKLLWNPRRRADAVQLWLHGYETVVRPALVLGRFRTHGADPPQLEQRIVEMLARQRAVEPKWGGSTAAFPLTKYYRGERTTVHVPSLPGDLAKSLKAAPDPAGNLVLLNAFGSVNWDAERGCVHPLLVYSEMLQEDSERAREAAQELLERYLAPLWES